MLTFLAISTAAAVNVTVCVDYTPDFSDSGVTGSTEDYFATNSAKPARGILIRAVSATQTFSVYAVDYGLDEGCATFNLNAAETWTIRAISRVEHYSHSVDVRTSADPKGRFYKTIKANWAPVAGTYDAVLPVRRFWNVLAAASQAMFYNTAGRPDLDVDFHVTDSSGFLDLPMACSTAPCVDGTEIYLDDLSADRKFEIAYLMGWAVLHDMGLDDSTMPLNATEDYCGNGASVDLAFETLEYPFPGFMEGFAHWYSASAFNRTTESNCSYVYWRPVNWDLLDVCFQVREAPSGHHLSCATGPSLPPLYEMVPDTNFRGFCRTQEPGSESVMSFNPFPATTVVPLDVLRFLRERVELDADLSVNDVGDAYEYGLSQSLVAFRLNLQAEAVALGASSGAWDTAAAEHGVDQ